METKFLLSQGALSIPCILSEPDYGEVRRIVLGVHGFGGRMRDQIQAGLAEEMELFYGAMVRFDFPAHGESPLGSEALTLHNCVESLLVVADWAKKRFPEVEDLCIFASGFGAFVTLNALEDLLEMPGKVKLVVQTPAVRMAETMLSMKGLTPQTLRAMDHVTFRAERPFDVTYSFYKELRDHMALNAYHIPMLILHSEEDAYIDMADIQNFHRINEESQLVIIPGTSHRFLEDGAWDMVLDLTRDWFEFEQVLLM